MDLQRTEAALVIKRILVCFVLCSRHTHKPSFSVRRRRWCFSHRYIRCAPTTDHRTQTDVFASDVAGRPDSTLCQMQYNQYTNWKIVLNYNNKPFNGGNRMPSTSFSILRSAFCIAAQTTTMTDDIIITIFLFNFWAGIDDWDWLVHFQVLMRIPNSPRVRFIHYYARALLCMRRWDASTLCGR